MFGESTSGVERVGLSGPREKPLAEQDTTHAETGRPEHFSVSTGADISVTLSDGCVRGQSTSRPTSAPEVGP